ncbi:TPA: DUF2195 family protein [Citrobacter farmeri]|uniref:DUF2195 family protein n=1 Tax=Citrobacter farmeri TaxID=67824 RepID=UPI00208B7467|nr:hypothetical protein TUM17580_24920 [Citrobacter farmeri]HCD7255169.1 DUF2195 family protein [Citrobacter farmeri]HCD7631837.1 DUF2195 family protein [Citrobacter farmeri]HEM7972832.1 DUF2195 family protein [Citrobacter farmeri]HEM7973794.1 DUF2195 family protein [Citrobacter farmeri]
MGNGCWILKYGCTVCTRNISEIPIYSSLRACVDIKPLKLRHVNNLLILNAEFTVKKNIQQCGCFYSFAHYVSVLLTQEPGEALTNPENHLQEGKFPLEKSRAQDLVISSESFWVKNKKLAVFIDCDWPGG